MRPRASKTGPPTQPVTEKDSLNVVCAWCGAVLSSAAKGRTSHGICKACETREFSADSIEEQLRALQGPPPESGDRVT